MNLVDCSLLVKTSGYIIVFNLVLKQYFFIYINGTAMNLLLFVPRHIGTAALTIRYK